MFEICNYEYIKIIHSFELSYMKTLGIFTVWNAIREYYCVCEEYFILFKKLF